MIEFIREFPILSLFFLGYALGLIGSRFYDKPKYIKYDYIVIPLVYAGLGIMAISGVLKILGY